MNFQLLPSTFGENGLASGRQHLTSFIIDDRVAIDAGSLGFAINDLQRGQVRDVVLTHAHLDHTAGLPLFIDDLFSDLTEPVRIHAIKEVIDILERDIFNWSVYPRFSELSNIHGEIVKYNVLTPGIWSDIAHLTILPLDVSHQVPATGFVVSDGTSTIAISGDTAEMGDFWRQINDVESLDALFVECAFPDEMEDLSLVSCHMSPKRLARELKKFRGRGCPIFAVNLKPRYREKTIADLKSCSIDGLQILEVGKVYSF